MKLVINKSHQRDLKEIVDIYNWAIQNTSATFDTETKTVETQLSWYEEHDENYPIIVAKQNEKVVAWGSISRWSDRCAYTGTGEVSLYVHPEYHAKGIGTKILKALIDIAHEKRMRTLVSRIAGKSDASIHLHKKLGFSDIGRMKNVGVKFGEVIDVHLMQILL